MNMIHSPCKTCTDRHFNCHSICDEYKQYQEYRHQELQAKAQEHLTTKAKKPAETCSQRKRNKWAKSLNYIYD